MEYRLDNEGRMFFTADSFDRGTVYCKSLVEDKWDKLGYTTADSVSISSSFSDLESKIELLTKELEILKNDNHIKENKLRSQLRTLNRR